jgi:Zinc carboxypeptidase
MLAHAVVLRPMPGWCRVAAGVTLVALLSACSTPGPVYDMRGRDPVKPTATATATATASAPSASSPVVKAASASPADPSTTTSTPYSAAVVARFSEPKVTYRTPAFAANHLGFTSNAELQALMFALVQDAVPATGQPRVSLLPLGSSQKGQPLQALLFTREFDLRPVAMAASNRPTVLLVAQQHGDEPAGSEALIVLAQELALGRLQGLTERINVIILPRANPDGASSRQRVTASGIDANRDHLLLKTPEAQAQAQLMRDYRPVVVVDAHEYTVVGRYLEKFGAVQRFDALVQYAMAANVQPFITKAAEEWFRRPLIASLTEQGLTSEWYYTTNTDLADKKISMGGTQPDTGRNVNGLKNAVSILIETRGVGIGKLHLARRVHTHVTAMTSVLQSTAERAADLQKVRSYVDRDVSAQACQGDTVVEAGPTVSEYALTMLDPVTGADKTVSVEWASSLVLRTLKSRARPCGYWLAADQTDAVMRLRGLGVRVVQLGNRAMMQGENYRETARELGTRQDVRGSIADGGSVAKVQVELVTAFIEAPAGSYYVPLDQPLANLVIAAMEPDTQNSYVTHGIVSSVTAQARVLTRPDVKAVALP